MMNKQKKQIMKTLSINILNNIRWFISVINFRSNPATSPDKEEIRLQKAAHPGEVSGEGEEKFDLAQFQRKAYCGNYFVGPFVFLHPDLFE
jgi:hypothetical protein